MPQRSYSVREVERGIRKLTTTYRRDNANGFERREGKEKWGWYYVDGKKMFYISSKLPPSGDVARGRIHAMRNQMRLTQDQFDRLCKCTISGPEYHSIIVEMLNAGEL